VCIGSKISLGETRWIEKASKGGADIKKYFGKIDKGKLVVRFICYCVVRILFA